MLKLHGFSSSNYYNVAKLALLEKELEFEEVEVYTGAGPKYRPDYLDMSPMGKVPCLETPDGYITESRCIIDYLEAAHPEKPLYPSDPFLRAKLQELTQVVELYIELPARRHLPAAFGRGTVLEENKVEVREILDKGIKALTKLANFDGFVIGDAFSAADISVILNLPVTSFVTQQVYGENLLASVPGLADYHARMDQRPSVAKVKKDAQANMGAFMAHLQQHYA